MIRSFWGEDLCPALIDRIVAAPDSHILEYSDHLSLHSNELRGLPELPAGHLRPVHAASAMDEQAGKYESWQDNSATVLLLYAHQIVMDAPLRHTAQYFPVERGAALTWLLDIKPLYDDGAIHFKAVSSAARHPSRSTAYRDPELIEWIMTVDDPVIHRSISHGLSLGVADSRFEMASLLLRDAASHLAFQDMYGQNVHKLFRSTGERAVFEQILGAAAPYIDSRQVGLSNLAMLSVPSFAPDLKSLVAVRRSSEAFAEWRQLLGNVLSTVEIGPALDDQRVRQIFATVQDGLSPLTERIKRASKRSPALSALQTGVTGFGVSAIAAGAGLLAGGSVLSSLAGAATTKTVEGAISYYKARQLRMLQSAVLELALSFRLPAAS